MQRIRAAVAAVTLLAGGSLSAESLPCHLQARWGERGISQQFARSGNLVFAAEGQGLAVYDVSDPRLVRVTGRVPTDSPATSIARDGRHLVLGTATDVRLLSFDDAGSVSLLDLRNEATAKVAASASQVVTAGTSLFLWQIEDRKLRQKAQQTFTRPIDAIAMHGTTLYVSERDYAVRVYDISANQLRQVAVLPIPATALAISGDRMYASGGARGLYTVDISSPRAPRYLNVVDVGAVTFGTLVASSSHLYASANGSEVRVYDLSAAEPRHSGTLKVAAETMAIEGNDLLIAGSSRGAGGLPSETGLPLQLFDLSVPNEPRLRGWFTAAAGGLTGAATDGRFAYVADPPLMRVVDLRSHPPRQVASIAYNDPSDRIRIFGQWAIVYGRLAAHIIDIREPLAPRYAGVFDTQGNVPSRVAFAGEYLLEANQASGFHVLDLTDPARPTQLSGLKNDGRGFWYGMAAMPGAVYGLVTTGIRVIDLTNPRDAREVRFMPTGRVVDADIAFAGTSRPLLVLIDDVTLRVFDLHDPMAPDEIGSVAIPVSTDLAISGDDVYVIGGTSLTRISIAIPSRPEVLASVDGFLSPTQVSADGSRVVVADRYSLAVLRRPEVEAIPAAPELTLASVSPRTAMIRWTGATAVDLDLASDATFSSSERRTVHGTSAVIRRESNEQFIRVRTSSRCSPSNWSNGVSIPPAVEGARFATPSTRLVFVKNTRPPSIEPAIVNSSAVEAVLTIKASDPATVRIAPAVKVAPHSTTTVPLTFVADVLTDRTVTLQLSDATGVIDSHSLELTPVDVTTREWAERDSLLLPGIGSLAGANGTRWRSDLTLYCSADCDMEIAYSHAGAAGEQRAFRLALAENESVVVADVAALAGGTGTSGVVAIYSSALDVIKAAGYTYNDSPTGRFGQRIPALRHRQAVSDPRATRQLLLGIAADSITRTNLGLHNPTSREVAVSIDLLSANVVVSHVAFTLGANASSTLPVSSLTGEMQSGHAIVTADPQLIAYASRVDQRTGDATFSYASRAPELAPSGHPHLGEFLLTGNTPGANDSEWKTLLQVANLSSSDATVYASFIPVGAPAAARSTTLTVRAAQTATIDGITSLFDDSVRGLLGTLRLQSDTPLAGWGRLYNSSVRGTFGHYVPLRDASPAAHLGDTRAARVVPRDDSVQRTIVGLAENASRRSNLVLAETAGEGAVVSLAVMAANGSILAIDEQALSPYETRFIPQYLRTLGVGGIDLAVVEVRHVRGSGKVDAFASVVEAATSDAIAIPLD